MIADLHCHTVLSDGSATIEQVMSYARNVGLSAIAITDHDTMAGVERARQLGSQLGIEVIDGAELSCFDYQRGRKVHVLCYLPDYPEKLEPVMNAVLDDRRRSGMIVIEELCRRFPLTRGEFLSYSKASTTIFKQHMMRALMDAGYSDRVFSELYFELFKRPESRIHVPVKYTDVYDALRAIRQANGIAVVAHAGFYDSFDLIEELTLQGLIDGVEVWHPENNDEQTQWLIGFADANGLLKTGGSDFHG
ncbi:MAG: PHP domain-containing protein, partial [Clostridia bacterium]|nr:PHP domain-containing protein [Clostridia bacterium]